MSEMREEEYHDPYDVEERFLVEQIKAIQEAYQKAAKPYVDQLVRIRSMRAPNRVYVTREQYEAMGCPQELKERTP